ncbi:hypothetical protein Goshw_029463 [Gossypium schwendimanii]|uniref:Uncharacterized protein n=2 Tax=Gossypium TaxID=3633 RepID=A0A7J9LCS6_GOSSC|nr:hypothetical protein [Gossypium schwendimanii]
MYRNVVDVVDVEPIEGSLIRFFVARVGSALTVHGCTVTHQGEVVPPSPKGDQYDIGYGFKPYQGQGARVPLMGDGHSDLPIDFPELVISGFGTQVWVFRVGQVQVADCVRLNRVGRFGLIKLGPQV